MVDLILGDSAPDFTLPTSRTPEFSFNTLGGRYIFLFFFGSSTIPGAGDALRLLAPLVSQLDTEHVSFFSVTCDAADIRPGSFPDAYEGRMFHDRDGVVSRRYGVISPDRTAGSYAPTVFLLSPRMMVLRRFGLGDPQGFAARIGEALAELPGRPALVRAPAHAPVTRVPHVFEPDLCARLLRYYSVKGGAETGVMYTRGGLTYGKIDHMRKRRTDCLVDDPDLKGEVRGMFGRRLVPALRQAFQFRATRMERYLIGRYDSETGGYFRPHRDNSTTGTAHRSFAITIGLSTDYDGGELRFREFGGLLYKPDVGEAIIFSCSLIHEVLPVRRGVRYVFLPFVHDEEAERQRAKTKQTLRDGPSPSEAGSGQDSTAGAPAGPGISRTG
jgi:peroxiredoxin